MAIKRHGILKIPPYQSDGSSFDFRTRLASRANIPGPILASPERVDGLEEDLKIANGAAVPIKDWSVSGDPIVLPPKVVSVSGSYGSLFDDLTTLAPVVQPKKVWIWNGSDMLPIFTLVEANGEITSTFDGQNVSDPTDFPSFTASATRSELIAQADGFRCTGNEILYILLVDDGAVGGCTQGSGQTTVTGNAGTLLFLLSLISVKSRFDTDLGRFVTDSVEKSSTPYTEKIDAETEYYNQIFNTGIFNRSKFCVIFLRPPPRDNTDPEGNEDLVIAVEEELKDGSQSKAQEVYESVGAEFAVVPLTDVDDDPTVRAQLMAQIQSWIAEFYP